MWALKLGSTRVSSVYLAITHPPCTLFAVELGSKVRFRDRIGLAERSYKGTLMLDGEGKVTVRVDNPQPNHAYELVIDRRTAQMTAKIDASTDIKQSHYAVHRISANEKPLTPDTPIIWAIDIIYPD